MIDLYTWTTPNGRKASIALEEMGLPYTVHAVDIGKDEQFKPEFLKISPNNRIPAIVDRDNGLSLMESGAILIYLADKTGKLLPKSGDTRYKTIEWLMWQMGGLGPMFGQVHHFTKYNPGKAPYAEERYLKEAHRLYGVLEQAARRSRVSRRRLFDRRHRDLAVGVALRVADRRSQAVSERAALVSRHRQQAGDAEGLQGAEGRRRGADPGVRPWRRAASSGTVLGQRAKPEALHAGMTGRAAVNRRHRRLARLCDLDCYSCDLAVNGPTDTVMAAKSRVRA